MHKARKIDAWVRHDIETLIRQELSPQQVAGYLEREQKLLLHHETIYQLISGRRRSIQTSEKRPANENVNGLIRQYLPKGTDFNEETDIEIKAVMERLNNRPRETRGFKSPNELFMGQRVNLLAA